MTSLGVTTRPITLISGKLPFCETFFENVMSLERARRGPIAAGRPNNWTRGVISSYPAEEGLGQRAIMLGVNGRLPRRYAPLIYGVIQAAITTGLATAIATHQLIGFGMIFLAKWMSAWIFAWVTMLPVVVLIAPLIQRTVVAITADRS